MYTRVWDGIVQVAARVDTIISTLTTTQKTLVHVLNDKTATQHTRARVM